MRQPRSHGFTRTFAWQAIAILIALWRFFALSATSAAVNRQAKNLDKAGNNPLGRVLAVYSDNPDIDIETLELKLDEAILRETAPIETGLSFIKVLYVVAPLLGLLGIPDFSTWTITVGTAEMKIGNFLNTLISFLLIGVAIFFIVVRPMQAIEARLLAGGGSLLDWATDPTLPLEVD